VLDHYVSGLEMSVCGSCESNLSSAVWDNQFPVIFSMDLAEKSSIRSSCDCRRFRFRGFLLQQTRTGEHN